MKKIPIPQFKFVLSKLPSNPKMYWRKRKTVYDGVEDCVDTINKLLNIEKDNVEQLQKYVEDIDSSWSSNIELDEKIENQENIRNKQEEIRQTQEQTRQDNEQRRLDRERDFDAAEKSRVTSEQERKIAEISRINNETTRESNETIRSNNEITRSNNETNRENNENSRIIEEQSRKNNENERIEHENNRITNEEKRKSEESIRSSNEEYRVSNENERVSSESTRTANETIRVTNENTRISNEETRQQQETIRQTNTSNAIANSELATSKATEVSEHPTYIGKDYYIYEYDLSTHSYNKTDKMIKTPKFEISYTYNNMEELLANQPVGLEDNLFAIINTGNTEDEDNAKLFISKNGEWVFIVDMSGFRGFQGYTPQLSIGNVSIGDNRTDSKVSLSENGYDDNNNPKFLINFKIPSFAFSDYTEQQITLLQKPATDKAAEIQIAENIRIEAENARISAENIRENNEITRNSNETIRDNNETLRLNSESKRESNENTRQAEELNRNNAEEIRNNSEEERINNDNIRQTNEQSRISNEDDRIVKDKSRDDAENIRDNNEQKRENSESKRVIAEDLRISHEQIRILNEEIRQSQEESRVEEENNRILRANALFEKFEDFDVVNFESRITKTEEKFDDYYNKNEVDVLLEKSGKVKSVNGQEGDVVITADGLGAVSKEEGKGLSTEDFTTTLKEKLDSLQNYNDTEVRGLISSLSSALDALSGVNDTTEAIDKMNEIVAFLETYKNTDTLASVLLTLQTNIEQWVENKNYLTEHQKLPTSLPANGGNADTVDGYHFVVGSSAGTVANTIYFVV